MNNLFILHTQYNIILGTAIALGRAKEDRNDLVVYAEFGVSDEYQKHIENVFDNVVYIRKHFSPLPKGRIETEWNLFKEYAIFKKSSLSKMVYDNVYLSQDRPLDCMIFGYFKNKNNDCKCADIEEDCYYSLNIKLNNSDYEPLPVKYRAHACRRFFYGKKYMHNPKNYYYGQSSFFDSHYVLYPLCVRQHIKDRATQINEITSQEIAEAVKSVYGKEKIKIPPRKKYYLFFFDLMERYSNPEGIKTIVHNLNSRAQQENSILLLKYHPRETNKFNIEDAFEIPNQVPAEKLLSDMSGLDVTVLGNATTSIVVASKFGFKTICIAKINGSDNVVMFSKFHDMGIALPEQICEI